MVRDSDIEQFPDKFGVVDNLVRKATHGKNVWMSANRLDQKLSRQLVGRMPHALYPQGEAALAAYEITKKYQEASGDDKTAYGMILDNLYVVKDLVFMTASPHYRSMWTRDAWFTAMYTDSNSLKRRLVTQLGLWQRPNGQVPTEVYFIPPSRLIKHYRDDESGLIWNIMALETGAATEEQLVKGQRYIDSHVDRNGHYISPAGTRRSILDALEFPRPSRIAYVAGLYAYETILAAENGFGSLESAQRAADSYRELASQTPEGYLPLSDTLKWVDQMAFYGEYLSLTKGYGLLRPQIVRNTRDVVEKWRMREGGLGLATEKGEVPSSEWFLDDYQRKRWFLFEHTLDTVCELHQIINGSYRQKTVDDLISSDWREYRDAPPQKRWQLWNVNILKQQQDVKTLLMV